MPNRRQAPNVLEGISKAIELGLFLFVLVEDIPRDPVIYRSTLEGAPDPHFSR